ncbi:uncharacterized protein LOC142591571 [Dermacentor variabilis]|uniref:uncharacterized protein LOC142591571 n=1 Tax=Dermacentor variabilis TaxID=34621 RepID=UPI003F5C5FB1
MGIGSAHGWLPRNGSSAGNGRGRAKCLSSSRRFAGRQVGGVAAAVSGDGIVASWGPGSGTEGESGDGRRRQIVTLIVIPDQATGSSLELPSEESKVGARDSRNTTTARVDLLVEILALSMAVAVTLMVLLIEVSYKWFIIWRIEAYAANMPN